MEPAWKLSNSKLPSSEIKNAQTFPTTYTAFHKLSTTKCLSFKNSATETNFSLHVLFVNISDFFKNIALFLIIL